MTLSDSQGFVHDPEGMGREKSDWVKDLKARRRGSISEYAKAFKGRDFHAPRGLRPLQGGRRGPEAGYKAVEVERPGLWKSRSTASRSARSRRRSAVSVSNPSARTM